MGTTSGQTRGQLDGIDAAARLPASSSARIRGSRDSRSTGLGLQTLHSAGKAKGGVATGARKSWTDQRLQKFGGPAKKALLLPENAPMSSPPRNAPGKGLCRRRLGEREKRGYDVGDDRNWRLASIISPGLIH